MKFSLNQYNTLRREDNNHHTHIFIYLKNNINYAVFQDDNLHVNLYNIRYMHGCRSYEYAYINSRYINNNFSDIYYQYAWEADVEIIALSKNIFVRAYKLPIDSTESLKKDYQAGWAKDCVIKKEIFKNNFSCSDLGLMNAYNADVSDDPNIIEYYEKIIPRNNTDVFTTIPIIYKKKTISFSKLIANIPLRKWEYLNHEIFSELFIKNRDSLFLDFIYPYCYQELGTKNTIVNIVESTGEDVNYNLKIRKQFISDNIEELKIKVKNALEPIFRDDIIAYYKSLYAEEDIYIGSSNIIADVYGLDIIGSKYSILGKSCMNKASGRSDKAKFYSYFEHLKIVFILEKGLLKARALVWCFEEDIFLDRIYYDKKLISAKLTDWTRKNLNATVLNSEKNVSIDNLHFNIEKSKLPEKIVNHVSVENKGIGLQATSGEYPYMDTFAVFALNKNPDLLSISRGCEYKQNTYYPKGKCYTPKFLTYDNEITSLEQLNNIIELSKNKVTNELQKQEAVI